MGYNWVTREGEQRFTGWVDLGGGSTTGNISAAQAAMLTEAFGPPTERPITPGTQLAAWVWLWWQPMLGLGIAGGVGYAVVRFHVRSELAVAGRFKRRCLVAAAATTAVGFVVMEAVRSILGGHDFRLGALGTAIAATGLGIAVATVGGWLSRPLTAIAGVPVIAASVFVAGGIGHEGDTFFEAGSAWEAFGGRAAAGLVIVALGLGAASTVGKHWARFVAGLAIVVGAALIGSGLAIGLSASEGLRWQWRPLRFLLPIVLAGAAAAGIRILSRGPEGDGGDG